MLSYLKAKPSFNYPPPSIFSDHLRNQSSMSNINLPMAFKQEVIYKECKHNHAASLGRRSFDGCREFLESDDVDKNGTKDAMFCAACGCHRNFHKKFLVYNPIIASTATPETHPQPNPPVTGPPVPTPVVQLVNHGMTTTNNNTVQMPTIENNDDVEEVQLVVSPPGGRKKRTMFTAEQRSQMIRFAERLGWRPQRSDKEEIQHFCMDMGISRRMFLVWLSNNRRRVVQNDATNTTTTG